MGASRMLRSLILLLISMNVCATNFDKQEMEQWAKDLTLKSNALVKDYAAKQYPEIVKDSANHDEVIIFISSSMPVISLQEWAEQAKAIDASLVMRGFVVNSLKKTIKYSKAVFGDKGLPGFNIDPELFNRYQVKAVPAVVIQGENTYDIIYGNVGLKAALNEVKRNGSVEVREIVKKYLKKL